MLSNKQALSRLAANLVVLTVFLTILSLTACVGPGTNQSEETAPSEIASTPAQSSSVLDTMEHVPDPNLIDKTWVWESKEPNGNQVPPIEVPDPENYTIVFNATARLAR